MFSGIEIQITVDAIFTRGVACAKEQSVIFYGCRNYDPDYYLMTSPTFTRGVSRVVQ